MDAGADAVADPLSRQPLLGRAGDERDVGLGFRHLPVAESRDVWEAGVERRSVRAQPLAGRVDSSVQIVAVEIQRIYADHALGEFPSAVVEK